MSELKPCPCCGSDAVQYRDVRGGKSIECIACGIGTAIYGTGIAKQKVVGDWNRRAQPEGMMSVPREVAKWIYDWLDTNDLAQMHDELADVLGEPRQEWSGKEALERGEGK